MVQRMSFAPRATTGGAGARLVRATRGTDTASPPPSLQRSLQRPLSQHLSQQLPQPSPTATFHRERRSAFYAGPGRAPAHVMTSAPIAASSDEDRHYAVPRSTARTAGTPSPAAATPSTPRDPVARMVPIASRHVQELYRALVGDQARLTNILRELRLLTTYTPETFERAKMLRAEANHAYQRAKTMAAEVRRLRVVAEPAGRVASNTSGGRCTGGCGLPAPPPPTFSGPLPVASRQDAPWPPMVPTTAPMVAPTSQPTVPATAPNTAMPVYPTVGPTTTPDDSSDVTPVLPPVILPPSTAPPPSTTTAGPGMTPGGIPLVPTGQGTGANQGTSTPSSSAPSLVGVVFGSSTPEEPPAATPSSTISNLFSSATVTDGTITMSADEFDHTIGTAITGITTVWEEITYILGVFLESFIGLVLGRPRGE